MSDLIPALPQLLGDSSIARALVGILTDVAKHSAMGAIVERFKAKRLLQWAAELNDDPSVTAEQIAEDDKLFAAFAVARCVAQAHSSERVSQFARLHASFLAGRVASPDEFAEFLHLLENLSEREFLILLGLRSIADNVGIRLGSNELLFGSQEPWRRLRTELAHNLKLSEPEVDSIVQGLTRTGFVRILVGRNGELAATCSTERLDQFLQALTKYDRTGIPKPPTISVSPYAR